MTESSQSLAQLLMGSPGSPWAGSKEGLPHPGTATRKPQVVFSPWSGMLGLPSTGRFCPRSSEQLCGTSIWLGDRSRTNHSQAWTNLGLACNQGQMCSMKLRQEAKLGPSGADPRVSQRQLRGSQDIRRWAQAMFYDLYPPVPRGVGNEGRALKTHPTATARTPAENFLSKQMPPSFYSWVRSPGPGDLAAPRQQWGP